jgi:hypothetical protein
VPLTSRLEPIAKRATAGRIRAEMSENAGLPPAFFAVRRQ